MCIAEDFRSACGSLTLPSTHWGPSVSSLSLSSDVQFLDGLPFLLTVSSRGESQTLKLSVSRNVVGELAELDINRCSSSESWISTSKLSKHWISATEKHQSFGFQQKQNVETLDLGKSKISKHWIPTQQMRIVTILDFNKIRVKKNLNTNKIKTLKILVLNSQIVARRFRLAAFNFDKGKISCCITANPLLQLQCRTAKTWFSCKQAVRAALSSELTRSFSQWLRLTPRRMQCCPAER